MAESIKLNGDKYIDAEGVYDHTLGKPLSQYGPHISAIGKVAKHLDSYVLSFFADAAITYDGAFARINLGGPVASCVYMKHSDSVGGSVILFSYTNVASRPIYYQIQNNVIVAEYFL